MKSGGKTRPWHSLISRFSSIFISYDALRPLLRDRKRDDFIDIHVRGGAKDTAKCQGNV